MTSPSAVRDQIIESLRGPRCLLLGAGASAAAGLPTMISFLEVVFGEEFTKKLAGDCPPYQMGATDIRAMATNKQVILRRLFHCANLGRSEINYDLEALFQFIYGSGIGTDIWRQDEDTKRLFWMYQCCINNNNWTFPQFSEQYKGNALRLDQWMKDTEDTIADLRRQLYEQYLITSQRQDILAAAANVFQFLHQLFPSGPAVVFTLNFDTVFEALDDTQQLGWHLMDGIGASRRTKYFDFKNFVDAREGARPLYLFKMHGSVTWVRDGEFIRDTYPGPATPGKTASVALAEPVVSKTTNQHPFGEMYSLFRGNLQNNKCCIAIGISFRDDNLRDLLAERLEDKAFKLVIVAPKDEKHPEMNRYIEELAKNDNVHWVQGYFGDDATNLKILKAADLKSTEATQQILQPQGV